MDIQEKDFHYLLEFIEAETGILLPETSYQNVPAQWNGYPASNEE